jgi:Flp pilus assembly protein TadG
VASGQRLKPVANRVTDPDSHSDANGDGDSHADADARSDRDSHADAGTDRDSHADAHPDSHADSDSYADTYPNAHPDAHPDANLQDRAKSRRLLGGNGQDRLDRCRLHRIVLSLERAERQDGSVTEPGRRDLHAGHHHDLGHLLMKTRSTNRPRGQALVEFSVALIPFLLVLMGIVDLGRGIYMNNGVSEAAREMARATAVHPGATLGSSAETLAVIGTQKGLVPGLGDPSATITFACTTISDVVIAGSPCASTSTVTAFVRVKITVPFSVITPVLSMVAPSTLSSTAHIQVP